MSARIIQKHVPRNFDSAYEQDFDDLVWGRRAGHMGHHEYTDASMPLWADFIKRNRKEYYIPDAEIDLIAHAAEASAQLIGDESVTIISRGCGTKFAAKEGTFLKYFSNIVGIVYLDRADAALEQSMNEGRALFPHAWHKTINGDLYDMSLRYPVEGTEVNVMFGLTLANIEGFPTSPPPRQAYVRNLLSMHTQMNPGAHFVTTFDHNHDVRTVEEAYAGQTEFAKHMLQRTGSIDPDAVDFVVKFHPESEILSHGFRFRKNTVVTSRSGSRGFRAGRTLWFNNSVKPGIANSSVWNKEAGFMYARSDIPREPQGRLGWHHLISIKKPPSERRLVGKSDWSG